MLPEEIYPLIFQYVDGATFLKLEKCPEFKNVIAYMKKDNNMWERFCQKDIPKKSLQCLLHASPFIEKMKWRVLYERWIAWKNIDTETVLLHPKRIYKEFQYNLLLARMSGNKVIYGPRYGNCIFTKVNASDTLVHHEVHEQDLHLLDMFLINVIENPKSPDDYGHTHLLLSYVECILLVKLFPEFVVLGALPNAQFVSVYRDKVIFYEKRTELVILAKMNFDTISDEECLNTITCYPIRNAETVIGLGVDESSVTIVTKTELVCFRYKQTSSTSRPTGTKLSLTKLNNCKIFNNELLLSLDMTTIYVVQLNTDQKILKSFVFEDLHTQITAVTYYCNFLLVGTAYGFLFVYIIKDWETFKLKSYNKKIATYGEPILDIDVQEEYNAHRIFLTTTNYAVELHIFK